MKLGFNFRQFSEAEVEIRQGKKLERVRGLFFLKLFFISYPS